VLARVVHKKCDEGLREQIKRVCTHYVATYQTDGFMQGIQFAHKRGPQNQDLYIPVNAGVFLFDCSVRTESEWCEIVSKLSKREVATPRKTLVKMAESRISNVMRINHKPTHNSGWYCNLCQRYISPSFAKDPLKCDTCSDTPGEWNRNLVTRIRSAQDKSEVQAFLRLRSNFGKIQSEYRDMSHILNFVDRDDVDISVIREGLDLAFVSDVMENS
jgi:hypothetical protein